MKAQSRNSKTFGDLTAGSTLSAKPELERRFRKLAKRWQQDTKHWSVAARKAEHEAYREIIEMGRPAIPLLLAELRRRPAHWFIALQEITKADPISEESEGDVAAMARAWLEWGKAQGYVE
jgi:hypothetical protein